MRTALPGLAQKEMPLQELLRECLQNTSRTRRVAAKRVITAQDWTEEEEQAWRQVKALVANNVPLSYRQPGRTVLMFPDASNLFGEAV